MPSSQKEYQVRVAPHNVKVSQDVEARVIKVDKAEHRIGLSVKK